MATTCSLTSSIFRNVLDTGLGGAKAEAYWRLRDLSNKGSIFVATLKEGLWHEDVHLGTTSVNNSCFYFFFPISDDVDLRKTFMSAEASYN